MFHPYSSMPNNPVFFSRRRRNLMLQYEKKCAHLDAIGNEKASVAIQQRAVVAQLDAIEQHPQQQEQKNKDEQATVPDRTTSETEIIPIKIEASSSSHHAALKSQFLYLKAQHEHLTRLFDSLQEYLQENRPDNAPASEEEDDDDFGRLVSSSSDDTFMNAV